jgi:D-3-phosphoglycerate dehydrogenase / 2-oxoglutarate reductase
MKNHNILAVIPARGGSKGILDKNIYPVAGKPLISYTIECAKKSKLITRCIVSTDSNKIAEIAKQHLADVPFLRPEDLATDSALAIDVIKHSVLEIEKIDGIEYNYLVMLQPTTPLKIAEDIDGAIKKLLDTRCDTVVSMVDVGANHPARMYTIEDDQLSSIWDEGIAMRPRQDLNPVYIRNGAIYACKKDVLFQYNALIGRDLRPFIMPEERSVNIDSMSDLVLAQHYLEQKHL